MTWDKLEARDISYLSLYSANKEKADANTKLSQYEKMFEQVKADPGKASDFLNKIEK